MTNHTLQIANTSIEFQMGKNFTPENPFEETIQVRYKLNGTVFGFTYEPNHWDSYEETFKTITAQVLNIMLSRVAWPILN